MFVDSQSLRRSRKLITMSLLQALLTHLHATLAILPRFLMANVGNAL